MPSLSLTPQQRKQYEDEGYLLFTSLLSESVLNEFDEAFTKLTSNFADRNFKSMHDPELLAYFQQHMDVESKVYNEIRKNPTIAKIAGHPSLASLLQELWEGAPFGVFEKMILRIDMPNMTEEVAHWHQDHFYVKGNTEIPTLWIPLQDVSHENGCLLIEPRSHKLGFVDHPERIGKRNVPSEDLLKTFHSIEIPMKRGDVLMFQALLFHSGQINQSVNIRYSFQFRYTKMGLPTDAGMGQVFQLV